MAPEFATDLLQLRSLMQRALDTVDALPMTVDGESFDVYVSGAEAVRIPLMNGVTIQKMPNLKSDQYTVTEANCPQGSYQDNISIPHNIVLHVMRGEMAFKTPNLPWIVYSSGDLIRLNKSEVHSFYALEDTTNLIIFTPPLK